MHITRQGCISAGDMIVACVYVDRLRERRAARGDFAVGTFSSCCRIAVAALILANKILNDDNHSFQRLWSRITIYDISSLRLMELEMMQLLDYNLQVGQTEYDRLMHRACDALLMNYATLAQS